jgi:uncharacterized membrane protein HdeD (DUF308 family)
MKSRFTILNISAILFIIGCIIFSVFNYQELSKEEGWGIVAMIGLIGIGTLLLGIDFLIQRLFTKKWVINTIGGIIFLITALFILKN